MPVDPRKKTPSASQAESHSVEKQKRLLTPEIRADPETQQRLGEKCGLALALIPRRDKRPSEVTQDRGGTLPNPRKPASWKALLVPAAKAEPWEGLH